MKNVYLHKKKKTTNQISYESLIKLWTYNIFGSAIKKNRYVT